MPAPPPMPTCPQQPPQRRQVVAAAAGKRGGRGGSRASKKRAADALAGGKDDDAEAVQGEEGVGGGASAAKRLSGADGRGRARGGRARGGRGAAAAAAPAPAPAPARSSVEQPPLCPCPLVAAAFNDLTAPTATCTPRQVAADKQFVAKFGRRLFGVRAAVTTAVVERVTLATMGIAKQPSDFRKSSKCVCVGAGGGFCYAMRVLCITCVFCSCHNYQRRRQWLDKGGVGAALPLGCHVGEQLPGADNGGAQSSGGRRHLVLPSARSVNFGWRCCCC